MHSSLAILALAAALAAAAPSPGRGALPSDAQFLVWPPPKAIQVAGPPMVLARDLAVVSPGGANAMSPILERAAGRLRAELQRRSAIPVASTTPLTNITVHVLSSDEYLGNRTKYDYRLVVRGNNARVEASSVYGAVYALETFTQLMDGEATMLLHSNIDVMDEPMYNWRGVMVDTGRRFFPVDVLKNLLDTMAANKLNVLHLHAADFYRESVESKLYPELTINMTHPGHYSQDDVRDVISYAKDRGIRVVPEFDMPGHSSGFAPLIPRGLEFCDGQHNQMYNHNKTFDLVHAFLEEMASLFDDEVLNIGADETRVTGPCTLNSTQDFDQRMLHAIENDFGKRPAGWEEIRGLDIPADTIVTAWEKVHADTLIQMGYYVVEAAKGHFYFTDPAPGGPSGWAKCWYNISTNVPEVNRTRLLGGEVCQWTDRYYNTPLFDPENDEAFGKSVGGMMWPRGYVAAAAFWNYDAAVDPTSDDFVAGIWKLNDQLAAKGGLVCPSHCSCNVTAACDKPYLPSL